MSFSPDFSARGTLLTASVAARLMLVSMPIFLLLVLTGWAIF